MVSFRLMTGIVSLRILIGTRASWRNGQHPLWLELWPLWKDGSFKPSHIGASMPRLVLLKQRTLWRLVFTTCILLGTLWMLRLRPGLHSMRCSGWLSLFLCWEVTRSITTKSFKAHIFMSVLPKLLEATSSWPSMPSSWLTTLSTQFIFNLVMILRTGLPSNSPPSGTHSEMMIAFSNKLLSLSSC